MALAPDAYSSSSGVNVSTLTWSHICTGADLLLVVGVDTFAGGGNPIRAVVGITYNGVALAKIDAQDAGAYCRSELWYLVAPATGTHDIIVDLGGGGIYGISGVTGYIVGGARSLTGADQSAPLGTIAKATGTTTPATVTIASAAGEYVVDSACAYQATAITMTVGTGQTEDWNVTPATGYVGAGSYKAHAVTSMYWALSVTALGWATVAVVIKPTSAPASTDTTVSELWVIPARTEPFPIADGYTGLLAQVLATHFPHLLAWKVDNGQFIWHDLGPVPAYAPLDAMAVGNVMVGGGTEPGLVLFGVESFNGFVTTNIGATSLPVAQRRYPQAGGVADTKSGVIFLSRRQFTQPHRITTVRIWGENVQQADTIRFGWRWDRKRWQTQGEIHGLPVELPITDTTSGLFLETVIGITDYQPWESAVPVITRVDVLPEPVDDALVPEPDEQIPGVD